MSAARFAASAVDPAGADGRVSAAGQQRHRARGLGVAGRSRGHARAQRAKPQQRATSKRARLSPSPASCSRCATMRRRGGRSVLEPPWLSHSARRLPSRCARAVALAASSKQASTCCCHACCSRLRRERARLQVGHDEHAGDASRCREVPRAAGDAARLQERPRRLDAFRHPSGISSSRSTSTTRIALTKVTE